VVKEITEEREIEVEVPVTSVILEDYTVTDDENDSCSSHN
jgi:hypothetical protein